MLQFYMDGTDDAKKKKEVFTLNEGDVVTFNSKNWMFYKTLGSSMSGDNLGILLEKGKIIVYLQSFTVNMIPTPFLNNSYYHSFIVNSKILYTFFKKKEHNKFIKIVESTRTKKKVTRKK